MVYVLLLLLLFLVICCIESLDMKYKIEHNLSDDEISDFAMLYRDHCEVRNQPFFTCYIAGFVQVLKSFGTIWKLIMPFSKTWKVCK